MQTLVWLACLTVGCSLGSSAQQQQSPRRPSTALHYDRLVIPDDRSVVVALPQPGHLLKLFYLLHKDVESLSLTVTPCGPSPVLFQLGFRNSTQTGRVEVEGEGGGPPPTESGTLEQRHEVIAPARKGLYTLRLSSTGGAVPSAEGGPGTAQLFATFMGSPRQLWPRGRLTAKSRPTKGAVFLRWSRTTVDPELTEYILVVEPTGGARDRNSSEGPGLQHPEGPSPPRTLCRALSTPSSSSITERTGERTSRLLRGLQPQVAYRAAVFALNRATNFSYLFAELESFSYSRPKPRVLVDRRTQVVRLRPREPLQVFRYKVGQSGKVELGVTACGEGVLQAELMRRGGGGQQLRHQEVRGQTLLRVDPAEVGAVYLLKLRLPPASPPVSAQVTSGGEEPILPEPAELHEFRGLRGCREVRLGWLPVTSGGGSAGSSEPATYCLRATQTRRGDRLPRQPDQCSIDQQLNSLGYSVLQCSKINSQDGKVISERLTNLRPGKQYDVQLSVKRGSSKRLSYKLVRVRTRSVCT